jgi:hypothetical protein
LSPASDQFRLRGGANRCSYSSEAEAPVELPRRAGFLRFVLKSGLGNPAGTVRHIARFAVAVRVAAAIAGAANGARPEAGNSAVFRLTSLLFVCAASRALTLASTPWDVRGASHTNNRRSSAMKKAIALLATSMAMALGGSGVAAAAITQSNNNGHPNTNPAGHCPTGQNQDATPGALNKCS